MLGLFASTEGAIFAFLSPPKRKPKRAQATSNLCGLRYFLTILAFVLAGLPAEGENRPLAVGFLGGWERADDEHRSVRQVCLRLRSTVAADAETFGNHDRGRALRYIREHLDQDRDGKLNEAEKNGAVVILYGQSMGGGAVVKTARTLKKWGVPVRLTVQVDSFGLRDSRIPANVRNAANFYQHEWLTIQGETEIRPEDPARTRIVANERMHYPFYLPTLKRPESRVRRWLGGGHARMEADPVVWAQVELLIRRALVSKDL